MSTAEPLDIIGGYAKSEFPEFNPEETINYYVETNTAGDKALFPTPGLSQKIKVTVDTGGRAAYQFKDTFFVVIKDSIYRIDSSLHASFIGNLSTDEGYVGISDNGLEVIFVDGVGGWIFDNATKNLNPITDPGFPSSPEDVTVLGGRFLVNFGGTENVGYSAINDGTSWPGLNFFSMEPYPDIVIALETLNGRLFVIGKVSTITYYLTDNANLPFRKDAPAREFGSSAVGSVVEGLGVLGWLARTENGVSSIMVTTGGSPITVSNEAIDSQLQSYSDVSDASAYIYKNDNGNIFYVINFTAANASWQFHVNSKLPIDDRWSKLESAGGSRQIANAHTYFNGKHYVLGYNDGNVYEYSSSFPDDAGVNMRRLRITKKMMPKNLDRFIVSMLTINIKQGTGIDDSTGEDSNPVLFLSVSKDGGITYGNVLTDEIGAIGRREWLTEFFRLGYFEKGMVLKIEHINKVTTMIMGASMQVQGE